MSNANQKTCSCRMSTLFNVFCDKPAMREGFDPTTGEVKAATCFEHERPGHVQFPGLRWRDVGFNPDSPNMLLLGFAEGVEAITPLLEEMYAHGTEPPGALMAKIAYHLRQMADKARAYAEKAAP